MSNEQVNVDPSIKPFLDEISDKLWSTPGRASIMVGAGFSKNAVCNSSETKGFPDWNQLGDIFFEKLHGKKPEDTDRYLNVLKLAEEVEVVFGRPALDQLIRKAVPDKSNDPSSLHKSLLELPWKDVFTTNYDTLLERAADDIYDMNYNIIVDPADLVYSQQPRIIKLHGSFPSKRPFVITQKDYRQYPKKSAPFVNTVRQSLLENVLCMVGFSGDDPNFLEWIGWISDNLKEHTPKIYMIGIANTFTLSQKMLLQDRNIIVLDFSTTEGIDGNHYKALLRFCDYMGSREYNDPLQWPKPLNDKFFYRQLNPEIEKREDELRPLVKEWERTRKLYPGWVVVPERARSLLYNYTNEWRRELHDNFTLPYPIDLYFTYEFSWRLEKCLDLLYDNEAKHLEKILYGYAPFSEFESDSTYIISPETEPQFDWNDISYKWIELSLSLFRFYRHEGKHEDWERLYQSLCKIQKKFSLEQSASFHYEQVLYALFSLNLHLVKEKLSSWPVNESLPMWEAKRAAIFAEIGEIEKAQKIVEKALVSVRSQLNPKSTSDISLLSIESYLVRLHDMLLVQERYSFFGLHGDATEEEISDLKKLFEDRAKGLRENGMAEIFDSTDNGRSFKDNRSAADIPDYLLDWSVYWAERNGRSKNQHRKDLRKVMQKRIENQQKKNSDRLQFLKQFLCDPAHELQQLENALKEEKEKHKSIIETRGFDFGIVNVSHHSLGVDMAAKNAGRFLKFCEITGTPFHIPGLNIVQDSADQAISGIAKYCPDWAAATFFRSAKTKSVDLLFNRSSLAPTSSAQADSLIDRYLTALDQVKAEIEVADGFHVQNFGSALGSVMPDVLSRLCCKATSQYKRKIVHFIKEIYKSPHGQKYEKISDLVRRLFKTLSKKEMVALIPEFLKFSYPEWNNHRYGREVKNPFQYIEESQNFSEQYSLSGKEVELVKSQIEYIHTDDKEKRLWGIATLRALYKIGALNDELKEQFAEALWDENRRDSSGFPDTDYYYKRAYFDMPVPESIDIEKLFKDYILQITMPIYAKKKQNSLSIRSGFFPELNELAFAGRHISFSDHELMQIVDKLVEWWDKDKEYMKKEKEKPSEGLLGESREFHKRLTNIVIIISELIGKYLKIEECDESHKVKLKYLMEEVREYGLYSIRMDASLVEFFPESVDQTILSIESTLGSNDDKAVIDALNAVFAILDKLDQKKRGYVLDILGQSIKWRGIVSLANSLYLALRIYNEVPDYITIDFEKSILTGLAYIAQDTDYKRDSEILTIEEKLDIRQAAAGLSYAIYKVHKSKSKEIPPEVLIWRDICLYDDEFGEIKKEWVVE